MPLAIPIVEHRTGLGRVVQGGAWQRLGLVPRVVAAQPLVGQAVEQVHGIGLAALAQVVPEAFGWRTGDAAQPGQLRVWAVVTGHQNQLHTPRCERHQLFDTVTPVADAAMQRHQDDLGMAQHLVDIQVDRGMVLHLHRVGQAQAGEITRQLLGGFGKQRQV